MSRLDINDCKASDYNRYVIYGLNVDHNGAILQLTTKSTVFFGYGNILDGHKIQGT